ncbi:hypothetical protein [Amycolatopsis anabasis]|uniref:hypothetical protein n=1 Tax=Amycolatopsis anabasis TaxID=1840409 RepID=UPI00131D2A75|nr:hypothetical protein [Amycolatopsis anabasis]
MKRLITATLVATGLGLAAGAVPAAAAEAGVTVAKEFSGAGVNHFTECANWARATENDLRAQGFSDVTSSCHGWSLPYVAGT